jgi:hypothetical protein
MTISLTIQEIKNKYNNINFIEKKTGVRIPEQTYNFVHTIEKTHKGSGIPILWCTVCEVAGLSTLLVASRGVGKSTVIKCIPVSPFRSDTISRSFDNIGIYELSERLGNVEDSHIMVKIEEFNTLSQYARTKLLTIISKVMTDKSYYHNVIGGENIDIKNCTLTCHIAIQPISYSKLLNQNVMWESLAKDRFLRFFMLNPIRKDTVNNPPEIIDLDCTPLDDIYVNTDISSLIHTFQNQVSIGRANNVSISIAKALASVMGYNTVNDTVVNFFNEFFKPYLDLIPSLEYRDNAGSEVKIHSGFINLISAVSEIETVGRAWIDEA